MQFPLDDVTNNGFFPMRRFNRGLLLIAASFTCMQSTIADEAVINAVAKNAGYANHALRNPGDAQRGQRLFVDKQKTQCVTCHRVAAEGGQVGPDLTMIGGKFDRPHLIEALLEPSKQMVEGYQPSTIVTRDGSAIIGIVKVDGADSVTLLDANNKAQVVPRDQIEQRQEMMVSLMPEGLANSLTHAEFTDLVAYLESLRPGGPASFGDGVIGPIKLLNSFEVQTVLTGLSGATALETLPDGRILICEQSGALRVVKNGKLLSEPMLTLDVERYWERGLIGVTVAPDFAANPFVYVCYVVKHPYTHHEISRFRVDGDRAFSGSQQILLSGDDQSKLGGNVPAGHQGGGMHFGNDGKLYIGIGEQTAKAPAQELNTLQGKILRINPDGSIPEDNPFVDRTAGKYRAIWAVGCRNPFTFAIDSATGLMLINDVGGTFEEINRGVAGANYGWPTVDHGPTGRPEFSGPMHMYPQASISGGAFAPASFGSLAGRYFFADFVHGWIKTIDPKNGTRADEFASGMRRPVDLRFGVDGSLYVLLRNAWIMDDKFEQGTGSLLRFRHGANRADQETVSSAEEQKKRNSG